MAKKDYVKTGIYNKIMLKPPSSSEVRQTQLEHMYRRQLMGKCLSRFTWEGLPNGIDPRFIEATIFNNGYSVFFDMIHQRSDIHLNQYDRS